MDTIAAALQACRKRIATACENAGRGEDSVRLVAVSKTFPVASILQAHAAGQRVFGESYLQEALPKIAQLAELRLEWHFVGPLQSNKTRQIAVHFDWVHGVSRENIAQRLSEQRPSGQPPLQVCIQVNVSGEASKSGVEPKDALKLAHAVAALPNLQLRGFMAIPEAGLDPARQRSRFRQVAELLRAARESGLEMDTLSMGMSDDIEAAIQEGATLVRVGTAIFGNRGSSVANKEDKHQEVSA